jgi:hypothetical protein
MTRLRIVVEAFLDGFAQAGLFGWTWMPGASTVFCEEPCRLEDSQFKELFAPLLRSSADEEFTE